MAQGVAQTVKQVVTHPAQEAASWTAVWLPILMMYSPVQVVCAVFALSFMIAPPSFAAAFWVGGLALYYAITLPGAPEHTGQHTHTHTSGTAMSPPCSCTGGLPSVPVAANLLSVHTGTHRHGQCSLVWRCM